MNEVSFSFFLDDNPTPKQEQEIDLKRLRIFVPFEVNFIIDEQYAGSFKSYVQVVDGSFSAGDEVYLIHSDKSFFPTEVGYFTPEYTPDKSLNEGQI